MARKKNQEVDRIRVPRYGVDIPLWLCPDNTFMAAFGEHVERGAVADQVKSKMAQYIVQVSQITWVPYIEVVLLAPQPTTTITEGMRNAGFVGLTLRRGYLGRKLDGTYMECRWDLPGFQTDDRDERVSWARPFNAGRREHRDAELVFPFEVSGSFGMQAFYYAYTEDLWARFTFITDEVRRMKAALELLVGTPAGLNRLLTAHLPALLTAPERGEP